ncbi:MAG: alanine--glyoxylate aminotransferase family protein [Bdellovibrionales bacterium]|nr:alanine--glyoxylate aminotransferase family protein [Bdellovibrionales bacterium]
MKKYRLLTPGPTAIPENVLAKFAEPIIHHRTSLFEVQFKKVQDNLQWLFQTKQPVLTLTATGTGAMDATVTNLFSPGDEVITVNGGKFGERWTKICRAYGVKAHEIVVDRGAAVDAVAIEKLLSANPHTKAVLFQASETSTGTLMPIQKIVELCHKKNVLSICDGITAVGIFNVPMDDWGLDVLITGSQKALMLPPGLAFISLSERAYKAAESSKLPKFYFNLIKERDSQAKQQTAWTPAISLVTGAVESLQMLRDQGREALFAAHEKMAEATRNAARALGLELFSSAPSPVLTTVKVPASFSVDQGKKITKIMQEKYGVIITGGQDELAGKILRFSHFGYTDLFDIVNGISALELTLHELGYQVEFGTGVGAVLKTYQ